MDARSFLVALLLCQAAGASGLARERMAPAARAAVIEPKVADRGTTTAPPLDRVADAVDAVESSHGHDPAMWRPDFFGPQGPMQVSASAAVDVGGGDRFDPAQNRAIGRAYLEQLRRRYQNWPDAIAAYNWGIGKMDGWIKAGRPPDRILPAVVSYVRRVIGDSGLCRGAAANWRAAAAVAVRVPATEGTAGNASAAACTYGFADRVRKASTRPNPTAALLLSPFEKAAVSARRSWLTAMRGMFGCTWMPKGSLRCR